MKVKIILLVFVINFCFSQNRNTVALKVYLKDAETNKNVKGANVTLEGYEIPVIKAKYEKKGKFYYFDSIPDGYNTVMTYHTKYNEKGYQNKSGLPHEITLALHNPLNVAIEFPYPIDKNYRFSKVYTNDYFVEDPFKIAIKIGSINNCKCIDSIIKSEFLKIEIIDVLKNRTDTTLDSNQSVCDALKYKDLLKFDNVGGLEKIVLKDSPNSKECEISGDALLFFRKKDGSEFKRFNDPIIKKLRRNNLIVNVVIYNRYSYTKNSPYRSAYSRKDKNIRKKDNFFYSLTDSEKSKILFYGDNFSLKTINNSKEIVFDDKTIYEFKILQYEDLGLGILDQYDYFIKENGKTFGLSF